MSIELPEWDIVPDAVEHGDIVVPDDDAGEKAWREWCEITNFLFAEKDYWTSVATASLLISKANKPGLYQSRSFWDAEGSPSIHYIYGFFKRVVMAPGLGSTAVGSKKIVEEPFVILEKAQDPLDGEVLTTALGQYAKIPLRPGNGGLIFDHSPREQVQG